MTFKNDKESILSNVDKVFEDVSDDFATVAGVLQHFKRWRSFDEAAFEEAYVGLCLPKIFALWVRLEALAWNPVNHVSSCLYYYIL